MLWHWHVSHELSTASLRYRGHWQCQWHPQHGLSLETKPLAPASVVAATTNPSAAPSPRPRAHHTADSVPAVARPLADRSALDSSRGCKSWWVERRTLRAP